MLPAMRRALVQLGLTAMGGWGGVVLLLLALAGGMAWPARNWLAPALGGAAVAGVALAWWLARRWRQQGAEGARVLLFAWLSGTALLSLFLAAARLGGA